MCGNHALKQADHALFCHKNQGNIEALNSFSISMNQQTLDSVVRQLPPSPIEPFEQIFRDHYPRLCQYAYVLTKERYTAEEVVNDVFLKYWAVKDTLRIHTSLDAYLVTATRNQVIDHLRKSARRRKRLCELKDDFMADGAMPHEAIICAETARIIETAVDALPKQGRLIFSMSRDRSMTYNEIARTLFLSVKTVEVHMGRSLKTLRIALRRQHVVE